MNEKLPDPNRWHRYKNYKLATDNVVTPSPKKRWIELIASTKRRVEIIIICIYM